MNDQYYGPNAYDSSKISGLQPINNSRFSFTTRKVRKKPLPRFLSGQCRELLEYDSVSTIERLKSSDEDCSQKLINNPIHECHKWTTIYNPKALLESENDIIGIFKICSFFFFYHYASRCDNQKTRMVD